MDSSGQPISPIFKGQAVQELHYTYWLASCSLRTIHCQHHSLGNCTHTCSWHPSWTALLLKMGPICCPVSVTSYQSMLHKIPEELRSHWHLSRSLKSRKTITHLEIECSSLCECEEASTDCPPHPHTSGREHTFPKTCSSLIMGSQISAETS